MKKKLLWTHTDGAKEGVSENTLICVAWGREMGDRDSTLVVLALLGKLFTLRCTVTARPLAVGPGGLVVLDLLLVVLAALVGAGCG